MSSLVSLFHAAAKFPPLEIKSMGPFIEVAFIPDTSHTLPRLISLTSLQKTQDLIDDAAAQFDHPGVLLNDVNLYTSHSDGLDYFDMSGSSKAKPFRDSFEAAWATGAEPSLQRRVRRMVDAVHGTEGGGQAGLASLEENAQSVREQEKLREQALELQAVQQQAEEKDAREFDDSFQV